MSRLLHIPIRRDQGGIGGRERTLLKGAGPSECQTGQFAHKPYQTRALHSRPLLPACCVSVLMRRQMQRRGFKSRTIRGLTGAKTADVSLGFQPSARASYQKNLHIHMSGKRASIMIKVLLFIYTTVPQLCGKQ